MDPNWSFSTQEIYRKFEARTDEMIKRSLAKAKDEMVKIIKDTYRRENADKTLSDEEVEDKTKPQIDEACQAIARLGELRGIDTSSIVVEVGSDEREDEANEGDIDTEDENVDKDDKVDDNAENADPIGTTRSRPPKRSHRRSIRDQSFKPRGKANIRAIADIIMSPQSRERLRSAAREAAIQDSSSQDAQDDSVQATFDRAEIVPRQLTFSNARDTDSGSASSSDDRGPETSTPNKKMKMPEEVEVTSSEDGPPGPLGLASAVIRTEGEESQGEESTGDTINDDISDCRFTSPETSANNNDDKAEESTDDTSSQDDDTSGQDGQRFGADDTRDGGPYETTRVHWTDSQNERDRQDEHVLNLHYPEVYWCSWCSRPNSIVNDVPIGNRPRRVSIETSEEELALQRDENLMVFPANYDEHDVALAKNVNDGLPSYEEVFQARIPEGHFHHVKPPLSYSPINAPIYQGPDLREDIDDDDHDVPANV